MRRVIRSFDRLLRRANGVFELSQAEECWLRVRLTRLPQPLGLPGAQLPAGAAVLELHAWNERVPPLPDPGADLAWAALAARRLTASLRLIAQAMRHDPRLAGIQALGAVTVLDAGPGSLLEHLGFTRVRYRNPLGRFGEFWENLYTWALMWAFNPPSLRGRPPGRLRRTSFWMSASEFLRRYDRLPAGARNRTPVGGR